jgi:hypothetical protein
MESVFAFAPLEQLNINVDGQAEVGFGQLVTGNYFAGLGAEPRLGRIIDENDDKQGAAGAAVISYGYWMQRFGGEAGVLGKAIKINNVPFSIIGVMPRNFAGAMDYMDNPSVYIAMQMEPAVRGPLQSVLNGHLMQWMRVMGRMKRGVSREQVIANVEPIYRQGAVDDWNSFAPAKVKVTRTVADAPHLRSRPGAQGVADLRREFDKPIFVLS